MIDSRGRWVLERRGNEGGEGHTITTGDVNAGNVSAFALEHLQCLADVMAELSLSELERLSGSLLRAYRNDKQVFTLGNGGSSSTASHMAADLVKNTISLTCTVSELPA